MKELSDNDLGISEGSTPIDYREAFANKDPLTGPQKALGALGALSEGSLLGFSGELGGMGGLLGEGQAEGARHMDTARERFAQESPMANFGLEMAGALANPITRNLGTKLIAARPFAGGALTGGLFGGAFGAGKAEEGERLEGALWGGGIGTLLGGPLSMLSNLAVQKGLPAVQSLAGKAGQLFQPAIKTAQQQADDVIRPSLQKGFEGADDAILKMQQMGPQATLMDASPEMAGLASAAFNREVGGFKGKATQLFVKRSKDAANRISGKITKMFGKKGQGVGAEVKKAIEDKAAQAGPLFDEARQQSTTFPQMNAYLQSLDEQIAGAEGTSFARALTSTRRALFKTGADGKKTVKTSVNDLMKVRDDLADKASSAFRAGNTKLWSFLRDTRNQFDDMVMPESYRKGNEILSSRHDLLDATDLGEKFFTQKTADLMEWSARATDSERQAYLIGLVNATGEKMGRVSQTGTPSKIFNTFNFKDKLSAVLGDSSKADDFIKMVETENLLKATETLVKGNSITAARQEAGVLLDQALQRAQVNTPTSRSEFFSAMGRRLLDAVKLETTLSKDVASAIEQRLLTQGPTPETIRMLMATPAKEAFKRAMVDLAPKTAQAVEMGVGTQAPGIGDFFQ